MSRNELGIVSLSIRNGPSTSMMTTLWLGRYKAFTVRRDKGCTDASIDLELSSGPPDAPTFSLGIAASVSRGRVPLIVSRVDLLPL